MVISVPYQLKSSLMAKERAERELLKTRPGDVRARPDPRPYSGKHNHIGGVLASIRTDPVWVKRAEIPDVSLNAGTNTSANEEYALPA